MSQLRAGAATVNITPFLGCPMAGYASRDRGSETVHGELHCKALVLEDSGSTLAIVTNDLIGVDDGMVKQTRELIEQATGIASEHILISASHTHFGPEIRPAEDATLTSSNDAFDVAYTSVLKKKMVTAVQLARQRLQPAHTYAGKGHADTLSFNRHTLRSDGTGFTCYRLPPSEENLTFGPIDPEVGILRIDAADATPIATLINFACHPVCSVDRMYAISADYPGHAMRTVEAGIGGVCLFTLGCAGNIVPIEREGVSSRKIGVSLAAEAIKTLQWLEPMDVTELGAKQTTITLPLKGTRSGKMVRDTEIQLLRIGNLGLVALPGEIFVEIGMSIKEASGLENLFVVSLANGSPGYVPTRIAYDQGGYESNSSPFAPGSGEKLADAAIGLL